MKKTAIAASIHFALLCVLPNQVMANETLAQLDKILVTTTRSDNDVAQQQRVTQIAQDEVERQQASSTPQLLTYLPNIMLSGGPRSQVQEVNIRGLNSERVLQLVDGVRQNFVSGHRPTYFLDPALLKSVDVLKGPSSSLWGSGALGGVVAQNTIHAADLLSADEQFGGFVKQGYESNSDKWLTTVALAGRYNDIDVLFSTYYRDGNDIEMGNGENLSASSVNDKGVLAKIDWFIDDAQTLTLNFRQADSQGGVPSNGAANVSPTSNFLIDRESETQHASFDYGFNLNNDVINSHLTVYRNVNELDESRESDNRFDSTEIETIGFNLNNQSRWANVDFIYGIDAYRDELDAGRGGSNRPVPPDATTEVWGAFTEVRIPLNATWWLDVGGRYDYFKTEADNLNIKKSDNAFSPSVALSWQATQALNVSLRYDEAFRAPSSEELYTTGTHFCIMPSMTNGCNTFIPNADLSPEESQNIELLADYQLSHIWQHNDALHITANVFHNDVDDFIEQRVDDPVFGGSPFPPFFTIDAGHTTYSNIDEARLKGFEISMNYRIDDFSTLLSYGQTRGENKKTGEDLALIPADKWVLEFNNAFYQQQLKAGVRFSFVESQGQKPDNDNSDYDKYSLVDLYARWQPKQWQQISVDLAVNNLTDQYYRVAFEELYMPGKDIRLSLKYDF